VQAVQRTRKARTEETAARRTTWQPPIAAAVAAPTVLGAGPNAPTGVVKLPPVLGVAGLLVEPGDEAPPGDVVELLVPASLHE
jgi:hypothetical protein